MHHTFIRKCQRGGRERTRRPHHAEAGTHDGNESHAVLQLLLCCCTMRSLDNDGHKHAYEERTRC